MLRSRSHRLLLAALVVAVSSVSMLLITRSSVTPRASAAQEVDPTYANGTTVYMMGPRVITNPDPNLLASAPPLYVLAFPINFSGCTTCGPKTLPSGYQPQCNPCFHPGLPVIFGYHDHVLTGAPGFGTNGTAGDYQGPWRITVMLYAPAFALSPSFQPITSDEAIAPAEAAGEFVKISSGPDPYEVVPGTILICPLVSSHA